MSEQKVRTKEELQNEYMGLLARMGELHYRKSKVDLDIANFVAQIDALQAEAAALNKKEQEEKKEENPEQAVS